MRRLRYSQKILSGRNSEGRGENILRYFPKIWVQLVSLVKYGACIMNVVGLGMTGDLISMM